MQFLSNEVAFDRGCLLGTTGEWIIAFGFGWMFCWLLFFVEGLFILLHPKNPPELAEP